MPGFSSSGFFGPSRCLIPTPGLTPSNPSVHCVCVRAHTHCVYVCIRACGTHTPTYTPTRVKNRETQTTPLFFLLSKITPHAKQQVLLQTSWTSSSSFPNAKWNKLHIHARICTSCSEREANVYDNVHNICRTYTPAHAWCSTTPVNACTLSAKNAYALVHARLCNGAEASLPWKLLRIYLQSCASIVQAVICHPPSCRLDEISRLTLFAQEIRPNPR